MRSSEDGSDDGPRLKVARLLDEYDLAGFGAELERRWTGTGGERSSLRELAADLNRRLVEHTLARADRNVLDGEAANVYRLLTDDSVSGAERTRVHRQLERDGVDVDRLQADFVTYQAVRSYLREHRGVEYDPEETDPAEAALAHVGRLQGRVKRVTRDRVESLRDGGTVAVGSFSVLADVTVICEDCGAGYDLGELVEEGACDCDDPGAE